MVKHFSLLVQQLIPLKEDYLDLQQLMYALKKTTKKIYFCIFKN
jgi:hypothetical protein